MKTLNISISEKEFKELGLESTDLSYSQFMNVVRRELARQRLEESVRLAEKYGLSEMTMDDINKEVKAVRENAADNH